MKSKRILFGALVILSAGLLLYMLLPVAFQAFVSTEVVVVNATAGPLEIVEMEVKDGEGQRARGPGTLAPGERWALDVRGDYMPRIVVRWKEGAESFEFEDHTDLWRGQTWRIDIAKGGKAVSGYE